MSTVDAVALLLTARSMGAIAVLRIAGRDAAGILARLTPDPRRVADLALHGVTRLQLTEESDPLDDALLLRTEDHAYELHLHGGTAVVDAVLAALERAGARIVSPAAEPEAATAHRGILADVLLALPQATTMTAARLLAHQADAGLHAWAAARLTALPHLPLWQLHADCQWLLARSGDLRRLLSPARVALIGPPNAGKSTLANALLGRPVAITSDLPGTTRDWIDAATIFTHAAVHVPVLLVDTAGIRSTADPLEQESIARTHHQARTADVVLLVLDAADPASWPAALSLAPAPDVIALNKCDLLPAPPTLPTAIPVIPISARQGAHLPELMTAILRHLDLTDLREDEPFAFAPRHLHLLDALTRAASPAAAATLLDALLAT